MSVGPPFVSFMRESARTEKTRLPLDAYQEWLKSQKDKPVVKGHGKKTTGSSFEARMTIYGADIDHVRNESSTIFIYLAMIRRIYIESKGNTMQ